MEEVSVATQNSLGPDPAGDIILTCRDHDTGSTASYRVSSKILGLASPVFTSMFGPSYLEGRSLLSESCPTIELKEDAASALSLMLNALHHQTTTENPELSPLELAHLALLCDKYDCNKPLRAWIPLWFEHSTEEGTLAERIALRLLAAYFFNDRGQFLRQSKRAISELAPGELANCIKGDILTLLPAHVLDEVDARTGDLLDTLEVELQATEPRLRVYQRCYDTEQLYCVVCGRSLPDNAKTCHPCRNGLLPTKYCTSETRVAEYFSTLQKAQLWPAYTAFRTCSVSEIANRFVRARAQLKHTCVAQSSCPLFICLDSLLATVKQTQVSILGICLLCVKENDRKDGTPCSHKS
ncbi:hypothetical protein ACN47E_008191 [Coniothyrium glycines]